MRRTILAALLASACALGANPVKIHGYITGISSPEKFDIDDYRIVRSESLTLDLDKGDYPDATFTPQDLRVGTELEVQGDFNDSTHELTATSIKVFFNDSLRVKRTAVIEHASALQRDNFGWTGTIHADGQIIHIDGQTRFSLKEGQSSQLTPGLVISYEGRRERDGSITSTHFSILANESRRGEHKLFEDSTAKVNSNGEISVHGTKYKLVPDAEAQSYVQRIGGTLVPPLYQDVSAGAARRLPFQFYLVDNNEFNAHAFANGTVVVNVGVFRVLTTEAQFAAVLGHEIAHATQQHAVLELPSQKSLGGFFSRTHHAGPTSDLVGDGYSRAMENQADRLGLEYMVTAGYDAREAAEVWRLAGHPDDSLSRRSYVLAEIHNNYPGINFQTYVRDREEFDSMATRFGNTAISQQPAPALKVPAPMETTEKRPGLETPAPATKPVLPGTQTFASNAVTISSDPAGSDVYIGGRFVGKTPLMIPTGSVGLPYIVTVRREGYRDWTSQLVSVPGKTNFRVELMALPAR